MKKIVILLVLFLSTLGTYADNKKHNDVYSASTMYIVNETTVKNKEPKQYKLFEKSHQIQHEINLNWGFVTDRCFQNTGLVDYVIGWRFNPYLFVGGGVGLHLYDDESSYGNYSKVNAEMPIYANAKVYFMKTRFQPFVSTSLGARFGFNIHDDIGTHFSFGGGCLCNINDKWAIAITISYLLQQMQIGRTRNYYYYDNKERGLYTQHGLSLRLGVIF